MCFECGYAWVKRGMDMDMDMVWMALEGWEGWENEYNETVFLSINCASFLLKFALGDFYLICSLSTKRVVGVGGPYFLVKMNP